MATLGECSCATKTQKRGKKGYLAEGLDRDCELLLADLVVLLLLVGSPQTLPRETASQKVEKDIAERLEIVATSLLYAEVRVQRRIPCSPCQVLVCAVGDMLERLGIAVLLAQPEVYDVHHMQLLSYTH